MVDIVVISADYPPNISGIGDYAYLLQEHLKKLGLSVRVITSLNDGMKNTVDHFNVQWKLKDIIKSIKILNHWQPKKILLQYPGINYGRYSLIPHVYILLLRILGFDIITTLHEYSNVVFLRRISEWIFILCSNNVVVTSDAEKKMIGNLFWAQTKISVIPIGPNIPISSTYSNYDSNIIISFGMFYPDKKIENVIEFMKQIEKRYPDKYIFRFVGGYHIHFIEYFEKIKQKANNEINHLEWFINKPISEVHDLIKNAFLAIQFYNDGVSMRRGSFIGVVSNGIPVITNHGIKNHELMKLEKQGVFYLESGYDVFTYTDRLKSDKQYYDGCSKNLRANFNKYGFDKIAQKYKTIIRKNSLVI